jgi:ABC-type uncharacterized transport system auxiliary subunit
MAETVKRTKAPAKAKSEAAKPKAVVEKAKPAAAAAKKSNVTSIGPSPEEIARLAHKYWAERGFQHGAAEQDWLRAERELHSRAS